MHMFAKQPFQVSVFHFHLKGELVVLWRMICTERWAGCRQGEDQELRQLEQLSSRLLAAISCHVLSLPNGKPHSLAWMVKWPEQDNAPKGYIQHSQRPNIKRWLRQVLTL